MYNRIFAIYIQPLTLAHVDSLCITSYTHSFFYHLLVTCVQRVSDAHLRPIYLKFVNRKKIYFFVLIIEY